MRENMAVGRIHRSNMRSEIVRGNTEEVQDIIYRSVQMFYICNENFGYISNSPVFVLK